MLRISIIALVCAALFTGPAGNVSLVERPARLTLEDSPNSVRYSDAVSSALRLRGAGVELVSDLAALV